MIQGDARPGTPVDRRGPTPCYWIHPADSEDALPEELWQRMVKGGRWAVILQSDQHVQDVDRALREAAEEFGQEVTTWRDRESVHVEGQSHDYHVGTVRAFKGLEANNVVVLRVEDFDLSDRNKMDELYVALSRARTVLHIVGPSLDSLTPDLATLLQTHCDILEV